MKKLLVPILLLIMFTPFYVNAESKYVYDVLKGEAESGGLAREYTGEHQDSMDASKSTQKIYHWYADNDTEGTEILNKNNVLFAGQCWQMIRTTDTGGVKIIYNGEAENNQCLNTRGSHIGYNGVSFQTLNSNYWYGTDYTYDSTNKTFKLSGATEQTTWNATTGPELAGKYTCKLTSEDGSCSTLYYVDSYRSQTSANVININSNSPYFEFGTIPFSWAYNSLAYMGYKYGTVYDSSNLASTWEENFTLNQMIPAQIVVGNSIIDNGDNTYTLQDTEIISSATWNTNYSDYEKKYTCNNTDNVCSNPRYITETTNNNYFYINAGEKILIAKNRAGLNLLDTITIRKDELIINSSNYESYKYTCNTTSDVCSTALLRMIINYNDNGYTYAKNYYYGSSVTWNNSQYSLNDTIELENYNNLNNLSTHHYICINPGEKSCNTVAYVFYYTGTNDMYYITLSNGVITPNEAIESMFTDNNNDSTIKKGIDEWYRKFLLSYNNYIEDTIFCNDRSVSEDSGWNPNGGMMNGYFNFKEFRVSNDLSCTNTTDQFSASNPLAILNYKVGLISISEMKLLNNSKIRMTGQQYWTLSPFFLYDYRAFTRSIQERGDIDGRGVNNSLGVRPAISLKPGTRYLSGNGSKDNPYVIDLTNYYSINVEINNETEDLNVEIDDLTQVAGGETVKFKVTPIKGHKVTSIKIIDAANNEIEYTTTNNKEFTFTMPSSNVTIIPSYERVKNAVNVEDNKNTKEFIIEVNDATAVVYEDTVRFKLEPESGYEVEDIDIIDEENNKIDYKKTNNINEYEFVMPDTDVIIKPFYRKIESINVPNTVKNPNTGTGIYIIIIFMLVISSITYITIKRRKNYILN